MVMAAGADFTVRVRFMGDLRGLLGTQSLTITLPQGSSVGDLLLRLCDRYGEPFTRRIFSGEGVLHHYVLIFLDGRDIKELNGLATKLTRSDVEIVMLPMFEGG